MNARQMAAMAEATRLTRQGRLLEATALIQQTLARPAATRRTPDAPGPGRRLPRPLAADPDPGRRYAGRGTPCRGWPVRLASPPPRPSPAGPRRVSAARTSPRPRP